MTQTPARREAQGAEVRCPGLEREEQLQEVWRVWLAATEEGHYQGFDCNQISKPSLIQLILKVKISLGLGILFTILGHNVTTSPLLTLTHTSAFGSICKRMVNPYVLLVLIKTQEELGEVRCVLLEAVIPHDHEVTQDSCPGPFKQGELEGGRNWLSLKIQILGWVI